MHDVKEVLNSYTSINSVVKEVLNSYTGIPSELELDSTISIVLADVQLIICYVMHCSLE